MTEMLSFDYLPLLIIYTAALWTITESSHVTVNTEFGKLVGTKLRLHEGLNVYTFHGVPYAEPISGDIFQQAIKVNKWNGTRKALTIKPACLFSPYAYSDQYILQSDYEASENCLYLSIYTPSLPTASIKLTQSDKLLYGDAPFPVVVYFPNDIVGHRFAPLELAAHQKLVIVVVNYRAGPAGYVCVGDMANRAIKDQRLSLEWIKESISSFHGDHNRVTIFGSGNAAVDASVHLLSKSSKFKRAWLSSGSSLQRAKIDMKPSEANKNFIRDMECDSMSESHTQTCLASVPTSNITDWYRRSDWQTGFKPCVDGTLLKSSPYSLYQNRKWRADVDLMIGFPLLDSCSISEEHLSLETMERRVIELLENIGITFAKREEILLQLPSLYDLFDGKALEIKLCELIADATIAAPSVVQADFHSGKANTSKPGKAAKGKVYMYEFAYRSSTKETPMFIDATRGDDLFSLLGVSCHGVEPTDLSQSDCDMSRELMSRLGNFARTGDPNSHNTAHIWPEYFNKATPETKLFSFRELRFSRVVRDYRSEKVKFWSKYLLEKTKNEVQPATEAVQSNTEKSGERDHSASIKSENTEGDVIGGSQPKDLGKQEPRLSSEEDEIINENIEHESNQYNVRKDEL